MLKKQKLLSDIEQARAKMFQEKEQKLSEEVQKEKNEFFKIINEMKMSEERDK